MSKLKTTFYLKNGKAKNGKSPIYAKIALGTTSTTMSTSRYISPDRWAKTNMLLKAKKEEEVVIKNYIYNWSCYLYSDIKFKTVY